MSTMPAPPRTPFTNADLDTQILTVLQLWPRRWPLLLTFPLIFSAARLPIASLPSPYLSPLLTLTEILALITLSRIYPFTRYLKNPRHIPDEVHLIPGFDEWFTSAYTRNLSLLIFLIILLASFPLIITRNHGIPIPPLNVFIIRLCYTTLAYATVTASYIFLKR